MFFVSFIMNLCINIKSAANLLYFFDICKKKRPEGRFFYLVLIFFVGSLFLDCFEREDVSVVFGTGFVIDGNQFDSTKRFVILSEEQYIIRFKLFDSGAGGQVL